ncbi:DUF1512 family protein [Methanobacterium sp.]|uniref:DUF1512 family protein n=1 Tax=Methanobacterium sp. TaxID=2164 RepID=UPI003C788CE7
MFLGITPFDIIVIIVIILLVIMLPIILKMRINSSIANYTLQIENMVKESKLKLKKISIEKGSPGNDPTDAIDNFMEFFIVPPVSLDPAGIMDKFESILDLGEEKFQHMTKTIAPNADDEWKSNITMTLKATLGINGVAKMVRHNLELSKKTGNLQILLMLQMGLPMIMRLVKAEYEGVNAFSNENPVGDGIGPLVAGMFMEELSDDELEYFEDVVIGKKMVDGHEITILRAKGPGARVGKIGKTVNRLINEKGIKRLITVDAAQKLEGEETGSVAEGIGVVIGGFGVDKWLIEEQMVKNDLEVDAIIIKMGPEEAMCQMTRKILESSKKALEVLNNSISLSEPGTKIMILGVGNSCGVPNIVKDITKINIKEDIKKGKRGH